MIKNVLEETLQNASEEYLKLLGYIMDKGDGYLLIYSDVQRETGVIMDPRGKSKLRRAILRSHREYAVLPNEGYKLAQPDMAMGILSFRLLRIDSQVKRADRAQRVIQDSFLKELTPEEKKGVLYIGAIFGAIRLAAEKGKKVYGKKRNLLIEGKPIVPD